MKVTYDMIIAAKAEFFAVEHIFGNERWKLALEAALSAAPLSDDYRRGLDDAAREVRALAERIEREFWPCTASQNVRDADAAIRLLIAIIALGEKK